VKSTAALGGDLGWKRATTLAGAIAGVLEPQIGEVRIAGLPLRRLDPRTLARHRVLIP
jgi:ATP-binding cassette subfamily C protein